MKHLLFYLTLLLLYAACNSTPQQEVQEALQAAPPKSNQIVIIFDQAPQNSRYYWPDSSYSGLFPRFELRYVDDDYITRYHTPKLAPERDTFLLQTRRDIVEVQHVYKGMDVLSFLFQNGDSVLFTYEGQKPVASILNRQANDWEVNYDLRKRELISGDKFPGAVRTEGLFAFHEPAFQEIKDIRKRVERATAVGYTAAIAEQKQELALLDSLLKEKLIAPGTHQFYQEKSHFDLAFRRFFTPPPAGTAGVENLMSTEKILATLNNSSAHHYHLEAALKGLRYHFLDTKVKFIRSSNANYPDYRQVYDSVRTSTLFSPAVKKRLLFSTIDPLLEHFPLDDRQKYWQKFQQDVPDSAMQKYISQKHALHQKVSNELFLQTLDGDTLSFSDILAMHQNKVIYLDFWASWCAPCIRALPASRQLQQAYQNKEVVFLYFSIDEDISKWKKAAQKHQLNNSQKSFVVANRNSSRLLDDLDVSSIPRYMILDRKGTLVHQNAPGPDSNDVREWLDQYLKESSKPASL